MSTLWIVYSANAVPAVDLHYHWDIRTSVNGPDLGPVSTTLPEVAHRHGAGQSTTLGFGPWNIRTDVNMIIETVFRRARTVGLDAGENRSRSRS